MSRLQNSARDSFFGGPLYIFLGMIGCIPVWIVTNAYIEALDVHNNEAVSTAVTLFCFAGIATGRYLTSSWAAQLTVLPIRFITVLTALFFASTCWLFIFPIVAEQVTHPGRLFLYWLPFIILCIASGSVIKLISTVNRNKLRHAQTAAEISKSELQLLQSKLSPHFLFNTLNNMYGISIKRPEKVPALLLKLSDLLRYSVYDANENFVPLKDEIAYLHNYIDFEKIRIGEKLVLNLDLPESLDASIKIAPLLLIIFIENAFKHAKNTAEKKIFIDMQLKIKGEEIIFFIKNSHSRSTGENELTDKRSGFGLTSARRRLELLYPGQFELNIQNETLSYQVKLQLTIK